MENNFRTKNRSKFSLKAHLIFVTKYRKPLLVGQMGQEAKSILLEIASKYNWVVHALEIDVDHVHILVEYEPKTSVAEIVKVLKQESTYKLRNAFPDFLKEQYWGKKIFWSAGYFASSIGEASTETIKHYIENQG